MTKDQDIAIEEIKKTKEETNTESLLRLAIVNNLPHETIVHIMNYEEQKAEEIAKNKFFSALAEFKKNRIQLTRNKEVSFNNTKYKYLNLAGVIEIIAPLLGAYGFAAGWETSTIQSNDNRIQAIRVTCILTHKEGYSQESTLIGPPDKSGGKNDVQAIGSVISYLQRYTLLAVTGLATDDQDDDGVSGGRTTNEKISDSQLHILRDLLILLGDKEEPLCKYLGVDSLENLSAVDYKKAKTCLDVRQKQKENQKEKEKK